MKVFREVNEERDS